MKNFPHQFNELSKLFNSLSVAKRLIDEKKPLNDENFGTELTKKGIYTYRNRSLSVIEYLKKEKEKPASNRGYLTVARDIRRLFELLGFLIIFPDKTAQLSSAAKQLLSTKSNDSRKELWKNALFQLGLEGTNGEISHPYRILLKLVNTFPGIETPKLMLALEAKNDSDEEFERISNLNQSNIEEIVRKIGTTNSMAANAVKVLPGIAEQLNDIERIGNFAYPVGQIIITEDEITTEERVKPSRKARAVSSFRKTSAQNIAKDPNLRIIASVSIDLTEAVKIRQQRLVEHQKIVRLLAKLNEKKGFELYEGKFDCLAVKNKSALLYEVKTILEDLTDTEKQTVKGVGQLKFYKFSIVRQHYSNIKEFLVFSRKPDQGIIEFCQSENIFVVWKENTGFKTTNAKTGYEKQFNPTDFI